ncbi:MAG: RdgB/HAM1 family non-canonical purine NTP pyrophosphatase [Aestuariivirgaceae bacterium]
MTMTPPAQVLESVLYAKDLEAAERFYGDLLGLERMTREPGRHAFFRCGPGTVLLFNPDATARGGANLALPVPPHGASGPGHLCFAADAAELDGWRRKFEAVGLAIEADFEWPQGGRSIYLRDPAGNSIEFAEPRIWGSGDRRRLVPGDEVVIATHNAGKLVEIEDLLRPHGIVAVAAASLGLAEPAETGTTFAANAVLKARAAAMASGRPALADDSGLSVDALGAAPGIHSARWAGPERDFHRAMELIDDRLKALGATTPDRRRARFTCVLCLAFPDGGVQVYEGRIDGRLVWPPRGSRGFGYDPMFQPDGAPLTFGEMAPDDKHAMSHRARAFAGLRQRIGTADAP